MKFEVKVRERKIDVKVLIVKIRLCRELESTSQLLPDSGQAKYGKK